MILYSIYFSITCLLFASPYVEALTGEKVQQAIPNEFTFVASLGFKVKNFLEKRRHFCGGSLITRTHVLTAAHCLAKQTKEQVDVVIGENDLRSTLYKYDVSTWIACNEWARSRNVSFEFSKNDVAIVTLKSPVNRADVSPVLITPLTYQQIYKTRAVITGWRPTNQGTIMDILRKATVTILTPVECAKELKLITNQRYFVGDNYLCNSAEPYALVSCGDSGGPLLSEKKVLLGVGRSLCPDEAAQWGNFSTDFLNQYRVNRHMSVDYYRDFIENVTNLLTRPREVLSFRP